MILTCPACNTRYLADSEGFQPSGRTVRCTNCEHTWFQEPPQDGPEQVVVEDVETQVVRSRWSGTSGGHSGRSGRSSWLMGILLVLVFVGALGGMGYLFRSDIARAWPPAKGLYEIVGLEVSSGEGLVFRKTSYSRAVVEGEAVLVVEGILANDTDAPIPFTPIRVILRDENHEVLDSWRFLAADGSLEPGGRQIFETRRSNPPSSSYELELIILPVAEN